MKLLIAIVNYRSAALTIDALRSLLPEVEPLQGDVHVVVVDNLSPDDSLVVLANTISENGWGAWCELRPLPRNGGFAYGNNQALPPSGPLPDYVLLLNPDTLVIPGAITTLLNFADVHPKAGIIGSRVEDPAPPAGDSTVQTSAFNFPSIPAELEATARFGPITRLLSRWMIAPPQQPMPHRCQWVVGACMLIRRQVFEQIGRMDEHYFMYYEEVDFCLRVARAGWEIWTVPTARVIHLVGQSSGVTDTKRPARRLPAYWFESRQLYFTKNHGLIYAVLADMAWLCGQSLHRVLRLVRGRPSTDPPHMMRDFLRHMCKRGGAR